MVEWRNGHGPERLMMVHAVLLLARAPKSRMVDHALHYHYTEDKRLYEVPEYALDLHTARGRQMGHGDDHWYEQASILVGKVDLDDRWEELSKQAQYAGKQDQTRQRTAKGNPDDPQQSLEV
jgi:replication-associated recombination protein RarA